MEQKMKAFQQAAAVLPMELRGHALALPAAEQGSAEELRLRAGYPLSAVFPGGERPLGGGPVQPEQLDQLVELASRASVHSVLDQLCQGFITIQGGHRVGLCGTVVTCGKEIQAVRSFSSAAVRIARQFPGIAGETAGMLFQNGQMQSTLILAPPGAGKTSLLRDLIRTISEGKSVPPLRIGVVDQRGELGACCQGIPQLELGRRTDVLDGCPKDQGLMMLLRTMNPQVLAVDEVTAPEDVKALISAGGCGVALLATVHGRDREDLWRRGLYRELMKAEIFRRLVTISVKNGQRSYTVEVLK